jgi:hypothetical protein
MTSIRFTLSDKSHTAKMYFAFSMGLIITLYILAFFVYDALNRGDLFDWVNIGFHGVVVSLMFFLVKRRFRPTIVEIENDQIVIRAGLLKRTLSIQSIQSVSFLFRHNILFKLEGGKKFVMGRMLYCPETLPFMEEVLRRKPAIEAHEVMKQLVEKRASILYVDASQEPVDAKRLVSVMIVVNFIAFVSVFIIAPFMSGATVDKLLHVPVCYWSKVFLATWATCALASSGAFIVGAVILFAEDMLQWRRSWADQGRKLLRLIMQPKVFAYFYVGLFCISMFSFLSSVDTSKPARNVATAVSAATSSSTDICKK